jgi:hypothetical protein
MISSSRFSGNASHFTTPVCRGKQPEIPGNKKKIIFAFGLTAKLLTKA